MNINATLIGQAIAFFLFVVFCMKYVWPPIMNALQERKKKIADGLAAADRGKHEKQLAEERAKETLRKAKEQASEILARADKRGAEIVDESDRVVDLRKAALEYRDRRLHEGGATLRIPRDHRALHPRHPGLGPADLRHASPGPGPRAARGRGGA